MSCYAMLNCPHIWSETETEQFQNCSKSVFKQFIKLIHYLLLPVMCVCVCVCSCNYETPVISLLKSKSHQWRIQKFWNGGGKAMYRPRRHLSQMRTTNYMPFIRKKTAYCKKKSEPIGEGGRPVTLPFEQLLFIAEWQKYIINKYNTIAIIISIFISKNKQSQPTVITIRQPENRMINKTVQEKINTTCVQLT